MVGGMLSGRMERKAVNASLKYLASPQQEEKVCPTVGTIIRTGGVYHPKRVAMGEMFDRDAAEGTPPPPPPPQNDLSSSFSSFRTTTLTRIHLPRRSAQTTASLTSQTSRPVPQRKTRPRTQASVTTTVPSIQYTSKTTFSRTFSRYASACEAVQVHRPHAFVPSL